MEQLMKVQSRIEQAESGGGLTFDSRAAAIHFCTGDTETSVGLGSASSATAKAVE